MTDDGYLHCELPNSAMGALYIGATDHRPDPGEYVGPGCGATPTPSSWLTPNRPTTIVPLCSLGGGIGATLHRRSTHRTRHLPPFQVWVSKWKSVLGSLIVAIRGVRGRDRHDQEAIGVACLPMCLVISHLRGRSDRPAPSLAPRAVRS